jgi:hypothetical protein
MTRNKQLLPSIFILHYYEKHKDKESVGLDIFLLIRHFMRNVSSGLKLPYFKNMYITKLVRYCNTRYDHNSKMHGKIIYNICDEVIANSSVIDKHFASRNYVGQ